MRAEGLTNKQIADRLGISPSTVYRYIGKMSRAVKAAEEQNKPCPVDKDLSGYYREEYDDRFVAPVEIPEPEPEPETTEVTEEEPAMDIQDKSVLKVIKEVRILDLEGALCKYNVNPLTGDVEFSGGVINGLLDKASLLIFIRELSEVSKLLEV
jgi:hypothetical protein